MNETYLAVDQSSIEQPRANSGSEEESIAESDAKDDVVAYSETIECPVETCSKEFSSHNNLLDHMATEQHAKGTTKMILLDHAKTVYRDKLSNVSIRQIPTLKGFVIVRPVRSSNTFLFTA